MKLSTLFSMLLAISLFLTACGSEGENTENPADKYDAMAKELCTCMTPLSNLYQEVVAATEAQDTAKVQTLIVDFERLSQEGEACAARLEAKYGNMDAPDVFQKAKAAVEKSCPEIAAMMAGALE